MAITIQLFFAHPGFVFTMVYHNLFYTRVWNILRYTINFAIIFWANALYWANTILGECNIGKCNIGRIQYWANAIRPYNYTPYIRRGVSHTPYRIHPKLHYYNITCNVFWVGSLVWLSHQNQTFPPINYPLKKIPLPYSKFRIWEIWCLVLWVNSYCFSFIHYHPKWEHAPLYQQSFHLQASHRWCQDSPSLVCL